MLDLPGSQAGTDRGSPGDRATPLIGRTEVLEEIVRRLEAAKESRAGLLLISGEGGVGKSTMLRATVQAARALEFQVLRGRALPSDLPQPFGLVQDLLRSSQHANSTRGSGGRAQESMLPLFLAPYDADSAAVAAQEQGFGTESSPSGEADRLLTHLANPAERIDANRNSLFARLSEFFLKMSQHAPLLLAIDDLQFGDDSSIEFLHQFVGLIDGTRTLIVTTVAPDAELPDHAAEVLRKLAKAPLARSIGLRRMTEPEVAQYVRWILNGRDPGRDAVMRWFTQTDGNPLFVEHLVRGSRGFGVGQPREPERPGEFSEILRDRIRDLAESERRVLVYGAVLGKEFDFPTLVRACGQEEERLSESVDRLVHGGILREKGGEVYEFVSERARTEVYSELTETRRRILHRKAAQAIEATISPGSSRVYELARQYYLGRDDAKAVEFNRRAADVAVQAYAFDTAVVSLERALEAVRRLTPRDVPVELRVLIELGRVLDEVGDLRRSEEVLLDAVARARVESDHTTELALALLGLAQTRSDLSQYASARTLATEAFVLLERLGNMRGLLAAHRVLGVASWRMGDLATAEQHQRSALELAERDGTASERGHAMIDLANAFILKDEKAIQEALALYEKAAAIFAEGLDHSAHARVLMNRALLHHNAGRMPDAVADMEGALAAAERSRSRIWIGYCCLNMAQFRAEMHQADGAKEMLDRATGLLEPLGDQLALQQARMISGMIEEEREGSEEAEGRYQEALALARQLSLNAETAEVLFRLARLALRRGDPTKARQLLKESRDAGLETLRGDLGREIRAVDAELNPGGGPAPQG